MLRVCVFALCFVLVSAQSSPCVFSENEFYDYTQVMNCFHSITLTDNVKYTTLETLKRSLELYAFYDIAHDSPDPNLPLHVNMQRGLQEIADRPYIFDFDFQEDLRYLYLQLNDAHTQYYLPTCYQNIQVRQAFAPIGVGDSTTNYTIKVSPYFPDDLVNWYSSTMNIYLPDYTDYVITAINGVPAFDYFMSYANHSVGISKDIGARFNYALTLPEPRNDVSVIMYGYWQQRTHRNPFPQTDSVLYELLSPSGEIEYLTLPWSFKALKSYSGQDSWEEDYYAPIVHMKDINDSVDDYFQVVDTAEMEMKNIHQTEELRRHKMKLLNELYQDRANEMSFELLVNTTHLSFWQLSDNKTLVMYLDTMAPGRLSGYYPALIEGFRIAEERGLTRLIIDLSNNGGGNICLGRTLLSFLQKDGWPGDGQDWGPEDLPLSDLAVQLIHSAVNHNISTSIWSPGFYDNQQNEHISNSDTSYLLPGVPHIRGGLYRNYSELVHIDNCGNPGYYLTPADNFNPEETLIVTNGFCGSTCALFANHLGLYDDVRTIVTGGIPEQTKMQYTAFPGGQVLEKEPMYAQLLLLRQNITFVPYNEIESGDVVPRLIATQADFRYCIREIYPPADTNFPYGTNPMEFTFQQATYHLYNNDVTASYPQYVWYEALDYFSN